MIRSKKGRVVIENAKKCSTLEETTQLEVLKVTSKLLKDSNLRSFSSRLRKYGPFRVSGVCDSGSSSYTNTGELHCYVQTTPYNSKLKNDTKGKARYYKITVNIPKKKYSNEILGNCIHELIGEYQEANPIKN